MPAERDPASYRDPSGFVFRRAGTLYRQIEPVFAEEWERFLASGLYEHLAARGWIVRHERVALDLSPSGTAYAVIRPEEIDFVSYPYEWSFGQLKDAALLTLDVQAAALEHGMTLKDASAYNIQYRDGRPILIDSLSFEGAAEDAPWIAYRQYCEHFLAPLALMAYADVRWGRMLRAFPDGVPLDLASASLPRRTWLRPGLAAHLHVHARAQERYAEAADQDRAVSRAKVPRARLVALLGSLRSAVAGLDWEPSGTEWADYADNTSYSPAATAAKDRLVRDLLIAADCAAVWDLGANTGRYSRIAAELGLRVVAFDIDPAAVERLYSEVRRDERTAILPLVMDVADPSPALGWAHRERRSLRDRAGPDVLLALALVHHMAISRNVPLAWLSSFLAELAPTLVLEWVPREDPMVRRLLATRRDIFADYSLEGLKSAFAADWEVAAEAAVDDSPRSLLLFRRRAGRTGAHTGDGR